MTETIIVAIIAFAGTTVGSIISVFAANKLSNYKIDELTKQVEKHNSVIERVYKLEQDGAVLSERINNLEKEVSK